MLCGVGLMATAGYLISRAAERPAVLSLTVAIVCVRFFGLTRPLARYLERLASHDLALRSLAPARASRVYERIEPLAPGGLEGYRRGDLLSRMVADVDALQNLHLRGRRAAARRARSSVVAVGGRRRCSCRPRRLVLAAGLLVGGDRRARRRGARSRGAPARRGRARAASSTARARRDARAARPSSSVYGREDERLAPARRGRRARSSASPAATRSPTAPATALRLLVTGATVAGVLAVARRRRTPRGASTAC